jgi:hypothetical protein
MASVALACAPARTWSWGRLAVLGAGLGLVATTKLALLPSALGVGIFMGAALVGERFRQPGERASAIRALLVVAVLCLAVTGPWWARNVVRYGNPLYPAALPIFGRGFQINQGELADAAFVPAPAAWPAYLLLEPHDEQSGFGALFAVGAIPGIVVAIAARRRARTRALVALIVLSASTLPLWWLLTQHFPRFLLGSVGLGFGALPWALVSLRRGQRRWGAMVLGAAAVFSALVTFDQGLLPVAQQPVDRAAFYDRVWGVDPMASELPESEGLLLNTGFAPPSVPEYAAYYPLLGPGQARLVVPIDGQKATDEVVARMRAAGLRYAYVLAAPENRAQVEAIYAPSAFEQVDVSTIVPGEQSGARRHLFRVASADEAVDGTPRYLFRMR